MFFERVSPVTAIVADVHVLHQKVLDQISETKSALQRHRGGVYYVTLTNVELLAAAVVFVRLDCCWSSSTRTQVVVVVVVVY